LIGRGQVGGESNPDGGFGPSVETPRRKVGNNCERKRKARGKKEI